MLRASAIVVVMGTVAAFSGCCSSTPELEVVWQCPPEQLNGGDSLRLDIIPIGPVYPGTEGYAAASAQDWFSNGKRGERSAVGWTVTFLSEGKRQGSLPITRTMGNRVRYALREAANQNVIALREFNEMCQLVAIADYGKDMVRLDLGKYQIDAMGPKWVLLVDRTSMSLVSRKDYDARQGSK